MAHRLQLSTVRFFAFMLSKAFKALYRSVRVNEEGIQRVRPVDLYLYPSVHLSIHLPLLLPLFLPLFLSCFSSICSSCCLFNPTQHPFIPLSIYPSMHSAVHLCIFQAFSSTASSVSSPVCSCTSFIDKVTFIYTSYCLLILPSIHPSCCPFNHLYPIHLSIYPCLFISCSISPSTHLLLVYLYIRLPIVSSVNTFPSFCPFILLFLFLLLSFHLKSFL